MAALIHTLIGEGADRIELQGGSQPRIFGVHDGRGVQDTVIDVTPCTAQEAVGLLRSVASPEQMRELELCGSTRFTHIHSAPSGARRIRVTGEMHRGDALSICLQNLGPAGS
jgi:hypothetical protein